MFVLVYVDDIVITGNNSHQTQQFIDLFSKRFLLKDLGELSYFLGIEVTRTPSGLLLIQRKYINDLLVRVNMTNTKPVATPMQKDLRLKLTSGSPLDDASKYYTVVGSLQYLHFTRPNIAFAIIKLSQFIHAPTDIHWLAAKHVLRYLAGTRDHGIVFRSNNNLSLHAFLDPDWAGNGDDFTSSSANIFYLGSHPITWSSKKQKTVARSSTEAEYLCC